MLWYCATLYETSFHAVVWTAVNKSSSALLPSHFSRVRLCDPIDGSPPGSAIPGILQARTLEWVAISFSNAWKWKEKVKSLSHVQLLVTPWTVAHQDPLSMGFSRREYWSGVPLPSLSRCTVGIKYFRVVVQHRHHPSPELFHLPKLNPLNNTSSSSPPPVPGNHPSISMNLSFLSASWR